MCFFFKILITDENTVYFFVSCLPIHLYSSGDFSFSIVHRVKTVHVSDIFWSHSTVQ